MPSSVVVVQRGRPKIQQWINRFGLDYFLETLAAPDVCTALEIDCFYIGIFMNFDDFQAGRLWEPWGPKFIDSTQPAKSIVFMLEY